MNDIAANNVLELDLRGYQCPLPVLKTRHRMRKMAVGEQVNVLTDDPLAGLDIPNFCNEFSQKLIEQSNIEDGAVRFLIERTGTKI